MSSDGKVRVVVRSRRVPVRSFSWQVPVYGPSGVLVGSETRHGTVYETELEAPHLQAIEAGKRLSCNLDLDFEVVDQSKANPLRRFLLRLAGSVGPRPSLTLKPNSVVTSE